MKEFGGIKGMNVALPCVNTVHIDENSDFVLLGCKFILLFFR